MSDEPELYEAIIDETGVVSRKVDPEELSPELRAHLDRTRRDGVTLSVDWKKGRKKGRRHLPVTAIHWHPGDRNELARIIIKHVRKKPMTLDLDGHRYTITPD